MGTEAKPVSLYLVDPLTKEAIPVGDVGAVLEQEGVATSAREPTPREVFSATCYGQLVDEMRRAIKSLQIQEGGVEYVFHTYTQRRRHRKKRINKKWAKRYGFWVHEYRASGALQQTII